MNKQLIVIADMEGASGIFDSKSSYLVNGSIAWRDCGRHLITSDVLAICDAANEFGIDEILIYDMHYAGNPEYNILKEKLPENVKFFDLEDRCFDWRRIRGQASKHPFGIITVGQHSRYGEPNAYFPHTIQSPPIKKLAVNNMNISEIGMTLLNFQNVKYIANIGCMASMKEARELTSTVYTIPVKDKNKNWEPSHLETYPIIKETLMNAFRNIGSLKAFKIEEPCEFSMELTENFIYNIPSKISWKGNFSKNKASWIAPTAEIGFEIFDLVREHIVSIENKL